LFIIEITQRRPGSTATVRLAPLTSRFAGYPELTAILAFVDLRQLAALIAIADHRSFSGAATALHTVQSNVSGHIKRLERELGVELVDRQTGLLTEEGLQNIKRGFGRASFRIARRPAASAAGPPWRASRPEAASTVTSRNPTSSSHVRVASVCTGALQVRLA
jgi:hypothetical protein